jgi:uncharacterized membrane protein (DUF106 family)
MHIENELVEFVTAGEQEYVEVIEEYEEEVLVQEEFPEPPVTDTANTVPVQGKPQCIIFILIITVYIYMLCIYVEGNCTEITCILLIVRAGSSS